MKNNFLNTVVGRFAALTLDLKLFLVFALVATISLSVVYSWMRPTYEVILPFTGWSAEFDYMSAAWMMIVLVPSAPITPLRVLLFRLMVILFMGLLIYSGFYELSYTSVEAFKDPYNNPWLAVSKYRFVWTILVPSVWLVAIGINLLHDLRREKWLLG